MVYNNEIDLGLLKKRRDIMTSYNDFGCPSVASIRSPSDAVRYETVSTSYRKISGFSRIGIGFRDSSLGFG